MQEGQKIDQGEDWWKNAPQKSILEYYPKLYPAQIKFKLQEPILDIGGGSGTFLKFLKIENATIMDLAGGESIIDRNYKFIKADLTKKLSSTKKYKTIFVMETLEHIKNPLYLMAQVYDLLENNGICYVSIPYTKLDPIRKNGLNSHVCRWNDYHIKDQLEKVGFNVKFLFKRRFSKDKILGLFKIFVPPPSPHLFLILELTKRLKH